MIVNRATARLPISRRAVPGIDLYETRRSEVRGAEAGISAPGRAVWQGSHSQ